MSAPSATKILRIPLAGLIATPTSMAGAAPYGGTYLGMAREVLVKIEHDVALIIDEGYGGLVIGAPVKGERVTIACVLRGFDNDAVQKVFPNTALGTWNDRHIYQAPKSAVGGYRRPGANLAGMGFKLLIAPKDEDRHPFVVLYNAMPVLADTGLDFSQAKEFGIQVGFHALPDTESTARTHDIGRKGSITL